MLNCLPAYRLFLFIADVVVVAPNGLIRQAHFLAEDAQLELATITNVTGMVT